MTHNESKEIKKLYLLQLVQWIIAVFIAAIICNTLLFLYHRPTGWIDRDKGATLSIWDPNTMLVHGIEGRGVYKVDSKGYLNDNIPLINNDYIIVVGSSYTQGKEVMPGKRYSDILNSKLANTSDTLTVYNCSQDGYVFPEIIKGFCAITEEFPDARAIVLEIGSTSWSINELEASLVQREYDSSQNGQNIVRTLSNKKLLSMKIKEYTPIYSNLKLQAEKVKNAANEINKMSNKPSVDSEMYKKSLDVVMKHIRSEYDGELIILYHPAIKITESGIDILRYDTADIFDEVCSKNSIEFIDVSDSFVMAYEDNYCVPYGFNNTQMGEGHLNEIGHNIIAEELFKVLEGGSCK